MAVWKVSTAFAGEFMVYDDSGIPITGLVNGNFTKQLTKNQTNDSTTVTITEIDSTNEPGKYKAVFTPASTGRWSLVVQQATYNPEGWQVDVDVVNRLNDDLAFPATSGRSLAVDASGQVSVGAIAAGIIAAATFATDAIDANALKADAANEIADALLDRANAIETSWTMRKILRVMAAAVAGKVSGGPGSPVFRDVTDAKDRITATADANGNRTAITLDGT